MLPHNTCLGPCLSISLSGNVTYSISAGCREGKETRAASRALAASIVGAFITWTHKGRSSSNARFPAASAAMHIIRINNNSIFKIVKLLSIQYACARICNIYLDMPRRYNYSVQEIHVYLHAAINSIIHMQPLIASSTCSH